MSSNPVQEYAVVDEVKYKLNIDLTDTSQDDQITVATNDSNNYIYEQITVHSTTGTAAGDDPSLSSMANNLAAAYFNFWISTDKDREEIERWQDRIQQYIMAKYGKKSANLLSGEETFGFTKGHSKTASSSSGSGSSCDCSPLTQKGDIWGYNTADARIPVGADNYILTSNSASSLGVSWEPIGSGTGDVVGPVSSTDNAIARYDGITGTIIQNSGVLIDDLNNVTGVLTIAIGDGTWIISEDGSDELLLSSPSGDGPHGVKVVSDTGEILLQNSVATNDYTGLLSSTFTDASSTTTDIAFSIQSNITSASDSGAFPLLQFQGNANSGAVTNRPILGIYNYTTKLWEINNDGTVNMQGNTLASVVLNTPTIGDFTNATHDHEDNVGGGILDATTALDATGTKDDTTFLRGDNIWAVPPDTGSGIISINSDTTAEQSIVGTTNLITVNTAAGSTTIDVGTDVATSTNDLSFFASTTSAQLAGVISDETGSGFLVFGTSPTIFTPTIASFVNATHDHEDATGGGQLTATAALDATGTANNTTFLRGDDTWAVPTGGSSLPVPDTTSIVEGDSDNTKQLRFDVGLNTTGITGVLATTFTTAKTITFPDAGDTLVGKVTVDVLTNKTINANNNTLSNLVIGDEVTGASTALTDTVNIVYLNTPNSYGIGNRQNFLGDTAGTAGLNVGEIAGNPTTQIDGDIWYNGSTDQLFCRINGANVDLGAGGGSGITQLNSDTASSQTLSGTTDRITVTDSTPDHAFDIASTYVGQSSITTLGTIGTGIWNGTAITYANLNLGGSIVNADINATAGIGLTKLAAITADRAVETNGSGFLISSDVTSTELNYLDGVTSSIQTQLDSKIEFPINFPEQPAANATATQDINFSDSDRHAQKFTLTQNTEFSFSGTTTDTTEYIDLLVVQDGTGGWSIDLTTAGVINAAEVEAGLDTTALAETSILIKYHYGSLYAYLQGSGGSSSIGIHDIWLDSGGITPVTSGALTTRIVGTGTNRKTLGVISFATGADTFATAKFKLPRNYDNGTITAVINWTTETGGPGGDVVWGVAGLAVSDDDNIASTAFGTEITVTDTQTVVDDSQDTTRTTAITLANTPADGDTIYLRIRRLGTNGSDTFADSAQLLGISIAITTDAATAA